MSLVLIVQALKLVLQTHCYIPGSRGWTKSCFVNLWWTGEGGVGLWVSDLLNPVPFILCQEWLLYLEFYK